MMSVCDLGGGCPAKRQYDADATCGCGQTESTCHLTSAAFPIIRAMISGEWSCSTCGKRPLCGISDVRLAPCICWIPTDEGE
jgi:hypothetical protein